MEHSAFACESLSETDGTTACLVCTTQLYALLCLLAVGLTGWGVSYRIWRKGTTGCGWRCSLLQTKQRLPVRRSWYAGLWPRRRQWRLLKASLELQPSASSAVIALLMCPSGFRVYVVHCCGCLCSSASALAWTGNQHRMQSNGLGLGLPDMATIAHWHTPFCLAEYKTCRVWKTEL